jgi:hypothetical protein
VHDSLNSLASMRVTIPFGGKALRGYLLRSHASAGRMPVVLCVAGPGQRKADVLRSLRTHAQAHRFFLLVVDLPGLDCAGGRGHLNASFVVEAAISAWVDYLMRRNDVQPDAIALFGNGCGADLATRGAASDDRFAAVVCDGGVRDFLERGFAANHFAGGGQPGGHRRFEGSSIARTIRCPVLVTREADDLAEPDLVIQLGHSLREAGLNIAWRIFDDGETTATSVVGSPVVNAAAFGWLADQLGRAGASQKPEA